MIDEVIFLLLRFLTYCSIPTHFFSEIPFHSVYIMLKKITKFYQFYVETTNNDSVTQIFKLFDEDATGKISFRNLKRIAQEIGETLTDEELQEMIDEADRDGDGLISTDEFYRILSTSYSTR